MRAVHALFGALALCFATAAHAQNNAVFPSGGGGGTPCTATASSLQYNNAGSFGCVTNVIVDATHGGLQFNTTGIGAANAVIAATGGNSWNFAGSNATGNGLLFTGRFMGGGDPAFSFESQSSLSWTASNSIDITSVDSGVSRNAAGMVEVNNGANVTQNGGAYRDLKVRNVYTATSASAPALTSCGSSPAIASGSTDMAGEVTMGTGSPTGCVITFNITYTNAPFCVVTWQSNLASMQYTISTSALTLTQTATSSNKVDYHCVQH